MTTFAALKKALGTVLAYYGVWTAQMATVSGPLALGAVGYPMHYTLHISNPMIYIYYKINAMLKHKISTDTPNALGLVFVAPDSVDVEDAVVAAG